MMTRVTDEMVEAACNKEYELVQHWPLRGEERFVYMNKPNMRAVLTAALAAAEPPSPMVAFALNVELKSLQDEVDAALRDGNSYVAEGLLEQERALQATIRQQISLAAAEPPDAPGDADEAFDAALEAMTIAVLKHEEAGQWRDWESFEHLGGEVFAARQHILDLHRQARMAGLRELRAEIEKAMRESTAFDAPDFGYMIAMGEIDAMLQGADGEGAK